VKNANPRQYFTTVEDLYKNQFMHFVKIAGRHVYNRDLAIDVVHDAFIKSLEYFKKHPEKKVRPHIMEYLVLRAAKRKNRESKEIPSGLNPYSVYETDNEIDL
jgi:DNA-directed RNA polymerase specialized sigma24 family protein